MEQIKEYEYVDLGLPSGLKWAKCNVGAETETDQGYYFQWGDIEDKSNANCDWSSYKHGDGSNFSKYNPVLNGYSATTDGKVTLDLDDDGNPEIEYSATKANLRRVFSELSNELGDEDHLFVYVIDHGGYDYQKKSSYICLWNDEKLYPEELNSYLDGCEAGYISFVMGQCYSGGFSRELQANNRIIMTACGEDEVSYCSEKVPFDEYVYHWTCGLNGYDAYGNLLSGMYYKSEGVPYYKTLKAAHAYACKMDMYTTDDAVVNETPCISIFENSTADDLTFDYVPDVCELYITSGEEPTTPKNVFNQGLLN